MIVGMDFGTTNSGMAVYDGRAVQLLPLDPSSPNPGITRTSLYVTNDQAIHIGRQAIDHYFEHNIGRPVKLRKVWIGELEIYAEDLYYVTDAFAYVDVLSPGRLFLSMKTSLRDAEYAGTVVGQFFYRLEDLVALYLTATRIRAEKLLGQEIRQLVLGRPVHFAMDPEHDQLAQSRLLQAAFRAGYEKVYLQYEPIAAAYSYEASVEGEQNVLVFDFGGGTLDITVMHLGDPRSRAVLATGGIPIAGDLFDQKIVRTKIPRHFGEGSYYGPRHKALTVPHWIYDSFANWQTILELQSSENRRILGEIAQSAQRRYQIEALMNLVTSNYGLHMFDIVERAKRRLSQKRGAEILLEGEGFKVREFLTRTEFEGIIRAEILAIEQHLDETVQASGLAMDEIDVVIRTGGSSEIPAFYEMLQAKFGRGKVRTVDTFSSVTAGLGIMGHAIEQGELESRAYVPGQAKIIGAGQAQPRVSPVNLELVQRRIQADETSPAAAGHTANRALVMVGQQGEVTTLSLDSGSLPEEGFALPAETPLPGKGRSAFIADIDEPLLFITTRYRFVLTSARQLADLHQIGLAITNLHQLEPYEQIGTVSRWRQITEAEKLLLVTSSGYTRTYPMNIMQDNVEAPVPLKFDQLLPGVPVSAQGVDGSGQLLLLSRLGRAVRINMRQVLTSGFQALNCGQEDRIMAAICQATGLGPNFDPPLLLVTADGYGRRFQSEWVPQEKKANCKGRSMVARRADVVAAMPTPESTPIWLLTSTRLTTADAGCLPLEDSSKTSRLLKLAKGESIRSLL